MNETLICGQTYSGRVPGYTAEIVKCAMVA